MTSFLSSLILSLCSFVKTSRSSFAAAGTKYSLLSSYFLTLLAVKIYTEGLYLHQSLYLKTHILRYNHLNN